MQTNDFDGYIFIFRHGQKEHENGPNFKVSDDFVWGSEEDNKVFTLASGEEEKLTEEAQNLTGGMIFQNAVRRASISRRAKESERGFWNGVQFERGANGIYQPVVETPNIGLAVNPKTDWGKKDVEDPNHTEDQHTRRLTTTMYFTDRTIPYSPRVALIGYNALKELNQEIDILRMAKNGEKSIGTMGTHSPNTDAMTSIFLDYLIVDMKHKIVELNEDNYPGPFKMGEIMIGKLYKLNSSNPELELTVKNETKGFKYTDLKKMEQKMYKHSLPIN